MLSALGKALARGARALTRRVRRPVSPARELRRIQRVRVAPWFAANGDETLRLDYPLGPRSLVLDLGGYKGQWASDIYARYRCRVLVFEPVERFFGLIQERFKTNADIEVFQFGLGASDAQVEIGLEDDATSMFKTEGDTETIEIRAASAFLASQGCDAVDLVKINIEGAEYDLLDHLLDSGWAARIDNLQIQFHSFVENAEARMVAIQARLRETHDLTYQYEFVWENWKRRN